MRRLSLSVIPAKAGISISATARTDEAPAVAEVTMSGGGKL